MSEDDVANVQAICAVCTQRAIELLEAGSGIVERAVDIHFQQNLNRSNGDSGVVAIDDDDEIQIVPKKQTKESARVPPKKKQRKSPSKKQTSDTSGKPKPSQSTINSFFTRKDISNVNQQPDDLTYETKHKTTSPITPTVQNETHKKLGEGIEVTPSHSSYSPAREDANIEPTQNDVKIAKITTENDESPKSPSKLQPMKESVSQDVDPRLSYATLAKALADTASTTKRNAKLDILKAAIMGVVQAVGGIHGDPTSRKTDAKTLTFALELMSGKIAPDEGYDMVIPPPLQVSGAAVSSAVMMVTGGVKRSRLREAYRATGDLGDVAAEFFTPAQSSKNFFLPRGKKEPAETSRDSVCIKDSASIVQIHGLLQSVASVPKGAGSQKQRHNILVKLLRLPKTKDEMRFLVRTLIDNMRLGATMKSILAALAMAFHEIQTGETSTPHDSAAIKTVQKTFDICPRINKIALFLLCGGIEKMAEECTLEVGTPIGPMLANAAHSLDEVKKLMTKGMPSTEELVSFSNIVVAEWKYDGVRCQAHYDGINDRMKLFSRHLIDSSMQYPDACRYLLEARQQEKVNSFILDAEIVGVAKSEGQDEEWRLLPFQILSTRRGTKNADDSAVQVRVFAFDLMFLNGVSLLKNPLWERQKLLREHFNETSGFAFASCREFGTFEEQEITSYLKEAVQGGAEGLMIKMTGKVEELKQADAQVKCSIPRSLSCVYESGTRSSTWLKLKQDYVAGDTLDVVPIGAWYGNGRKAEKGFLSPVLLAVYDEDDGVFRSISRCMSFTDKMYAAMREFYFRGTPYPDDLGRAADGPTNQANAAAGSEDDQVEANHEEEIDGGNEDSDIENESGFVGVNCFPDRPPASVYVTNESPTIWFQPKEVWEVSFADMTMSRTHTAAEGLLDDADGRGVSLRFPRFKRRRPDKGVEQATTSVQIAHLYRKQFKQR